LRDWNSAFLFERKENVMATWVEAVPRGVEAEVEQDWSVRALPTLPSVLFRFLGLVGNRETTAEELADFIWRDPALLSRILPMATGSWSRTGLDGAEEGALRKAVASLSRERIRSLAFTTPLLRSFEPLGAGSLAVTYWERALVCGAACEAAARQLKLAAPERYYVAGLLHDIGYLVLLHKRPAILPVIFERWARRPSALLDIEEDLLGTDHCRIGLQVASSLGMDPWLDPAFGAHHQPGDDPVSRITAIGAAFASSHGVDFFPRRSLSRAMRERHLSDVVRALLPDLTVDAQQQLVAGMAKAVRPIRSAIHESIIQWQVAGESRLQPYFVRSAGPYTPLHLTA
jgi:HD-like signal output (HDOD) protein